MYSGIIWVCLNWAFPAPKDFVETCCGLGRGEIFSLRHAGAKRLTIPFQNVHGCAWLCLGELVPQGQISQRNTSPLFFDTYWNWTLRHLDLPSLDSAWNLNNTVTISEVNVTHSDVLRIGSHAGPWEGTSVLSSCCGGTGTGPCSEELGTTLHCQTLLSRHFHTFLRGTLLWSQTLASCGQLKNPGSGSLCVILKNSFSLSLPPFPHQRGWIRMRCFVSVC